MSELWILSWPRSNKGRSLGFGIRGGGEILLCFFGQKFFKSEIEVKN